MNTADNVKSDVASLIDVNTHYGLAMTVPHNHHHHQPTQSTVANHQQQQVYAAYYNQPNPSASPFGNFVNATSAASSTVVTVTSATPPLGAHIDEHIGNLDSCMNELNSVTTLMNHHSDNIESNSQSPQPPLTPSHNTGATATTTTAVKKTPKKQPSQNTSLNEQSANLPINKRRKKDPLAPKAPLNGYLVYFNEERVNMRQKHPNMSFGELTKIIAIQWKELKQEDKQKYTDEAEADKERYIKEMESYKKSDAYKHYVKETAVAKQQIQQQKISQQQQQQQQQQHQQKQHHQQQQQQQQHHQQHHQHQQQPNSDQHQFNPFGHNWPPMGQHYDMNGGGASSSMIASSMHNQGRPTAMHYHHPARDQQTNGNTIPIFTDDFMDHNKAREQELRHLRKEINEYEQQNSVLTKHIDTMKQSIQKYEKESEHVKLNNDHLEKKLGVFRSVMIKCFSNLPLPNTSEYPNEMNIDDYIFKLYTILNSNASVLHHQHPHHPHQQQQYQLQPHHAHMQHQLQTAQQQQQVVVDVQQDANTFVSNMKSVMAKFDFTPYIDC
jgi:hypothetical protein